jgi:hypothetical protein
MSLAAAPKTKGEAVSDPLQARRGVALPMALTSKLVFRSTAGASPEAEEEGRR